MRVPRESTRVLSFECPKAAVNHNKTPFIAIKFLTNIKSDKCMFYLNQLTYQIAAMMAHPKVYAFRFLH